MKIIHRSDGSLERSAAPIFEGAVATQTLVDEKIGEHLRLTIVHFEPGARTRLHTHTCEQMLIITEGSGILATEQEQHGVAPGMVVVVPAGEKHWHGGGPSTAMTHLAVLTPGKTEVV